MHGILCFGDSITFGRGETPNIGWAGRLKKYFESKDFYNVLYKRNNLIELLSSFRNL